MSSIVISGGQVYECGINAIYSAGGEGMRCGENWWVRAEVGGR